ncbi:MAG TPA: serine protease [Dehalococcoidia bacterium]|nr:serine protease [Dehalococcoidia bacterium]
MKSLRETIAQLKPAVPTIALVLTQGEQDKHITLGTGINIHPYGFVVTALHVIEEQIHKFVDVSLQELVDGAGKGKLLTTANGLATADLAAVFYSTGPGVINRIALPIQHFVGNGQDDVCGLGLTIIEKDSVRIQFPTGSLGGSLELSQGDEIAALGYPFGEVLSGTETARLSASAGIVGAIVPSDGAPPDEFRHLQMDMLLNPGNSGGPVFLRSTGLVVGIVSSRFEPPDGSGPSGISFAVPEHCFRELMVEAAAQFNGEFTTGRFWNEFGPESRETAKTGLAKGH